MPTIVYCQHGECGRPFGQTGELPSYCPKCHRKASWATHKPPAPPPPIEFGPDDTAFLKSIERGDAYKKAGDTGDGA